MEKLKDVVQHFDEENQLLTTINVKNVTYVSQSKNETTVHFLNGEALTLKEVIRKPEKDFGEKVFERLVSWLHRKE